MTVLSCLVLGTYVKPLLRTLICAGVRDLEDRLVTYLVESIAVSAFFRSELINLVLLFLILLNLFLLKYLCNWFSVRESELLFIAFFLEVGAAVGGACPVTENPLGRRRTAVGAVGARSLLPARTAVMADELGGRGYSSIEGS